jgi:retron-type reverse transcriptase
MCWPPPVPKDGSLQAALKLVLEPIFEADFHPCSYGFRPKRRAHDAIAEIHQLTSRSYEWVVEGDIEDCFDNIDHTALLGRVQRRIGNKRVLALGRPTSAPSGGGWACRTTGWSDTRTTSPRWFTAAAPTPRR